jgi:hypothetical protein
MSEAHYSCRYYGTELQKGRRGQSWGCTSVPVRSARRPVLPQSQRRQGMGTDQRLFICLTHGRLFHPPTRAWIPLPDSLRDWAPEQVGRYWIFTAAPCEQFPAAPWGKDAPPTVPTGPGRSRFCGGRRGEGYAQPSGSSRRQECLST